MRNPATSMRNDRDRGSAKTWDVGNDLRWRGGFVGIGPAGTRGPLGSSGILPASLARKARFEDEDTRTH